MHKIPLWAYLALALAISLGLNVWQAKSRWIQEAVAPLQQQLDTFVATDKAEDAMGELKVKHDAEIQALKKENQSKSGKRQVVYRDRVLTLPAAGCAPGQDRVDAWNAIGLGAKE